MGFLRLYLSRQSYTAVSLLLFWSIEFSLSYIVWSFPASILIFAFVELHSIGAWVPACWMRLLSSAAEVGRASVIGGEGRRWNWIADSPDVSPEESKRCLSQTFTKLISPSEEAGMGKSRNEE